MHVETIAKNRIHFVQARPSMLFQQLSNMKNVVFWSVTPCSLIDQSIWFRENVSLKWAAVSTETSTLISIVFTVSMKFRNRAYLLMAPFDYLTMDFPPQYLERQMVRKMYSFI
jgi:hypothetical protein